MLIYVKKCNVIYQQMHIQNIKDKTSSVLLEIDHLLATNHKGNNIQIAHQETQNKLKTSSLQKEHISQISNDGIHRIVKQSANLLMVTDLLQLRLRTSQKKRKKFQKQGAEKGQNIKQLISELQQSKQIISQTMSRCRQLEAQSSFLKQQLAKSKFFRVENELRNNQNSALKKQNYELQKQLQRCKQQMNDKYVEFEDKAQEAKELVEDSILVTCKRESRAVKIQLSSRTLNYNLTNEARCLR